MAAIFDLPLTQTSDSVRTILLVLLDTEYMDVAFVISLLFCLSADAE